MPKKQPNPTDVHVGTRLRSCRLTNKLTQVAVAEALGITFQQIQKYEKGANRISAGRVQQLAELFHVPVAYFFEGLPQLVGAKIVSKRMPDYIGQFIATREGIALAEAFASISDDRKRRLVVSVAEALADQNDKKRQKR